MTDYYVELTLTDLCHELQLSEHICVEIVEYGIVRPHGRKPGDWTFDPTMLTMIRRALRLQQDLELDWPDVAIITRLLDERDRLQEENLRLKQRLSRFLED